MRPWDSLGAADCLQMPIRPESRPQVLLLPHFSQGNSRKSQEQLAPCQEKRIKRQQTVSSAGCKVLASSSGFLLATLPSHCRCRPIECSCSKSVFVSVPQDKFWGSAIALVNSLRRICATDWPAPQYGRGGRLVPCRPSCWAWNRGVLLVGSWVLRGSDRGSGHCKLIQKSEPTKPALK